LRIGDQGCKILGEALLMNTTLQELCLSKCGIKSKGVICLTGFLRQNPRSALKNLYLSSNYIKNQGILEFDDFLSKAKHNFEHINLKHNLIDDEILELYSNHSILKI
jgi:Ran GTPase-activating protein (RanGAP) involved in mRNA processing and transport